MSSSPAPSFDLEPSDDLDLPRARGAGAGPAIEPNRSLVPADSVVNQPDGRPRDPNSGHQQRLRQKRFLWWYDAIIDWMLENPDQHIKAAAPHFNTTEGYLRIITNSDSFKARWNERRALLNEHLAQRISGKTSEVALRSLELMAEQLTPERARIRPPKLKELIEIADMSLSRLGYGVPSGGPGVIVQVNTIGASPEALQAAREKVMSQQARLINEVGRGPEGTAGPVGDPSLLDVVDTLEPDELSEDEVVALEDLLFDQLSPSMEESSTPSADAPGQTSADSESREPLRPAGSGQIDS